ncbi:DUF6603 domain-containing protein [Streptomyces sp. NPDC054933]
MALSRTELLDLFPEIGGEFTLPVDRLGDIPGIGPLLESWLGPTELTVTLAVPDLEKVSVRGSLAFAVAGGTCEVSVSFAFDGNDTVTGMTLDFALPATEEDAGEEDSFAPRLKLVADAGFAALLVLEFTGENDGRKTMEFAADYRDGTLRGNWSSATGVTWNDLARALGTVPIDLPPALAPDLTQVAFTYAKTKRAFVFAASTEHVQLAFASLPQKAGTGTAGPRLRAVLLQGTYRVGIGDLPAIGEHIPLDDDLVFAGLQAFHLSTALKADKVEALNGLLTDVGVQLGLPARDLTEGGSLAVTATVDLIGETYVLVYPLRRPSRKELTARPPGKGRLPDLPTQASIPVDAVFGPLRISEIGLSWTDGTARVTLDATLDAGGIHLSVAGLGFEVRLATGDWSFRPVLSGLGLDFNRPPVRIAGAFLVKEATPPYDMLFAGAAVIEVPVASVKVLGAYARAEDGYPSLFLYGVLGGRNGLGPPPFQVRGIAAGFGYNSTVRLPAPVDTPSFPFIAQLGSGGDPRPPREVLAELLIGTGGQAPWLRPALGQLWFALGLDFTVFQLVEGKALALVEFGDDFTVGVLGLATASFPVRGTPGPTYARVQLAMQALYTSSDGMLSLAAVLTPESFVLDPECRLTGGLAYRTWFSGPYEGDFVFCLGGYRAGWDAPDRYPVVPRLGYTWGISNCVTVRGEAYCALTPSAFMAGGRLEVSFHSGIVDAWLTARLDVLIQWKPFFFRLGIGIRIGFAVDLWLFTVKGEVGVDLDLWGPPVGGIATVHLWCIDFDVSFGASLGRKPEATWSDVQEQLPARDEMLRVTPLSGILPEEEATRARRRAVGDDRWVVSRAGFSFATATALPASEAQAGTKEIPGDKDLDIRPMGVTGLSSVHSLTVRLEGDEGFDLVQRGWTVKPVKANVPQALWGTGEPDADDPLVPGQLVGLTVTVPAPEDGGSPGEMTDVSLGFEDLDSSRTLPIARGDEPTGPVPRPWQEGQHPTHIGRIADGIHTSTVEARDGLYAALTALGVAPSSNDRLDGFARLADATFTAEPMTV